MKANTSNTSIRRTVSWVEFRDDGYGDERPSSVEYDFILQGGTATLVTAHHVAMALGEEPQTEGLVAFVVVETQLFNSRNAAYDTVILCHGGRG